MTRGMLLTDDEVVALSALAEKPWPTGLFTVTATSVELRAAALRGVRSLTVRGLLAAAGPDTELRDAIDVFLHPAARVGAYLAPVDTPRAMAGSALTLALADRQWWLDASTPDGIHAIRKVTAAGGRAAIEQFADCISSGALLDAAADPSHYGCAIRWGTGDGELLFIAPGAATWDRTSLDAVFAGAVSG
ncbi:MAG: hypothetical protein QOE61_2778 [Micromonosporaceae bacterium]|nr:hypothetical protein [Micromonosporaceae bacterium]